MEPDLFKLKFLSALLSIKALQDLCLVLVIPDLPGFLEELCLVLSSTLLNSISDPFPAWSILYRPGKFLPQSDHT